MSDSQQQRSAELNNSATPARRNVARAAFAAFILGTVSVFALLMALCGPLMPIAPQVALFLTSIGAAALAIPAVIALRKGAKENHEGWARARHALIMASVAAGLVLVVFAMTQGLDRSHRKVNQIKCRSNLRALGQAMLLYAQDNKGQFPQQWSQLITHADVNPEVLICPASSDRPATGSTLEAIIADFAKPGHCSYIYLGAGSSMSSVPKSFVLAYEPLDNHEKEGAHFIFGDASVEWLEAKDAQRLIDQLKSGVNPPKR
jgi:hypothetical protein